MRLTRQRRAALLLVPSALVAGVTIPASGARPDHPGRPPALLRASHARDAAVVAGRAQDRQADEGGDADEVMARFEWMNSVLSAPAVSVPARALRNGSHQANALPTVGGHWSEVTDVPFLNDPVNRGDNYGVGWHYVSGRMTALTSSGNAVFAGAADGGVWRSTDNGKHWTPVNDGLPRIAVGALATNPSDGSVWVGLGEANTAIDNQAAFGIYRLTRGSTHWQRIGGPVAMSRAVYYIRFIHGWAYAATQQGLLRRPADDPNSPWRVALKPDPNPTHSPYRTSHVTDVTAVPGSSGHRILAVVGWRGGSLPSDLAYNGFYVSRNGGSPGSFRRIHLTGAINPQTLGRTTFSTSGGRIYAVVEDTSTVSLLGQGAYVSMSGNPKGPWRRIADPYKLANSDSALAPPPNYFPGVQAWYNQYIKADPRHPRHVYLGLEEVYESINGGKTWSTIGPYWNYGISCNPTGNTPYACPSTTHPDQHAITFQGNRVYVGNDGGVWRRPKFRHSRGHWFNTNKTLHTLQYYSAQVGRSAARGLIYWGGLQDNGETVKFPNVRHLEQAFTGDGGDTIVDPNRGTHAVVEYVYMDLYSTVNGGRSYREISPSCVSATYPIENCDPSPQFIAPLEADNTDTRHWVTGGQYVWETMRGWATVCDGPGGPPANRCDWKQQFDQGAGHSTTAIDVSGDTIYAPWCGPCNPATGTPFARGMSTNAGGSWHQLNMQGLPNRYISSVYIDPANAMHATITFGSYSRRWIDGSGYGHVWTTADGGRTWRNVSGNLPDAPAHDVVQFAGGWAVATDVGVFWRGPGAGAAWSRLGANLPRCRVWDLTVTPSGKELVAATHGRGQWRIASP
jgi:photosystem II stability/assembly factor-like uncharacterized protein